MLSEIMKGLLNDKMSYGKIIIIVVVTFAIFGCTTKETSKTKPKYGHWIYRGSSTFDQIFQCVEIFEPHQNKDCE